MLPGVLDVEFRVSDAFMLQIELHARGGFEDAAPRRRRACARVVHVVIRLATFRSGIRDVIYDRISSVEGSVEMLPQLRTVTLETRSQEDSVGLVERLPTLRGSGKLHRRTHEEAQRMASKARQYLAGHAEEEGVISPLWYSEQYTDDERYFWCVGLLRASLI